ncbi:MAG: hypothetical protein AAF928_08575 [Myxococcota bacterium]
MTETHELILKRLSASAASMVVGIFAHQALKHGVTESELLRLVDAQAVKHGVKLQGMSRGRSPSGFVRARSYLVDKPCEGFRGPDGLATSIAANCDAAAPTHRLHRAQGLVAQGRHEEAATHLAMVVDTYDSTHSGPFGDHWTEAKRLRSAASVFAETGNETGVRAACRVAKHPTECSLMLVALAKQSKGAKRAALLEEAVKAFADIGRASATKSFKKPFPVTLLAVARVGRFDLVDALMATHVAAAAGASTYAMAACLSDGPPARTQAWMKRAEELAALENDAVDGRLSIARGCAEGGDRVRAFEIAREAWKDAPEERRRRMLVRIAQFAPIEAIAWLRQRSPEERDKAMSTMSEWAMYRGDLKQVLATAKHTQAPSFRVRALTNLARAIHDAGRTLSEDECKDILPLPPEGNVRPVEPGE